MIKFEDAMVQVLEMAQGWLADHPRPTDETVTARFDHQQKCLLIVEDYIVNELED
jgi:hypothetical protein